MASQPTIWRRNRAAIQAKQAAKRAENDAYRQQFIDAAAADEAKAAAAASKAKAEQKQAPQPQATKQQPQQTQRR